MCQAPKDICYGQEEVEEVEQKVAEAEHSRSYARQFFTKFCTPVFLEAFVLTFLAGQQAAHSNPQELQSRCFHFLLHGMLGGC